MTSFVFLPRGCFGSKLYSLRDSRQPKHPGRSMFQVFVSIILESFWDLSGIDFRHLGGRFSTVTFGVPKPPGTPPRALVAPKMGPRTSPEGPFGAKSGPREPSEGQTGAKKGPRWASRPPKGCPHGLQRCKMTSKMRFRDLQKTRIFANLTDLQHLNNVNIPSLWDSAFYQKFWESCSQSP